MANTQINQIPSVTSIDMNSKFIVDSYNQSANTYTTKSISYSNLMAGANQYGNIISKLQNLINNQIPNKTAGGTTYVYDVSDDYPDGNVYKNYLSKVAYKTSNEEEPCILSLTTTLPLPVNIR